MWNQQMTASKFANRLKAVTSLILKTIGAYYNTGLEKSVSIAQAVPLVLNTIQVSILHI